MKQLVCRLEFITRAFCGGADPETRVEIRAPSIRGQLRWWFRVLGGFTSLHPISCREQEAFVFGSVAGKDGQASQLQVRVRPMAQIPSTPVRAENLGFGMNSPEGYLLFPMRQKPRAGITQPASWPGFELHLAWRGPDENWEDIQALATVFGHLGALGFRSRRCMGALAFQGEAPVPLQAALARFQRPQDIIIKQLPTQDSTDATQKLANWLKGWRAYGRSPNLSTGPGFRYAKTDHDTGLGQGSVAYRPALGLPVIQRYSSLRQTNTWEENQKKGAGRFASPVLLRPYRRPDGRWLALVIFVESRKWPQNKQAFLNGQAVPVSLDLYNAMKADSHLQPFTA
ncbi:MAG: type III-B CRISPR module RAMP protein Cmr1 [Lentisphaerae bacterium]|nr:type III-B CRISPR module RAMP protein Cmr1 [Lentisphaerota bacterium]